MDIETVHDHAVEVEKDEGLPAAAQKGKDTPADGRRRGVRFCSGAGHPFRMSRSASSSTSHSSSVPMVMRRALSSFLYGK